MRWLTVAASVALGLAACSSSGSTDDALDAGDGAATIDGGTAGSESATGLMTVGGGTVSLDDYTGQDVILWFWAPW